MNGIPDNATFCPLCSTGVSVVYVPNDEMQSHEYFHAIHETLTPSHVWAMADVLNGVARTAHVRRLMPNGDIAEGHLRHYCGPDITGPRANDVRDWYIRVTLRSGMETAWPLVELARQSQIGEFAIDKA
jgi:hypothetical protein